jgi:hypothetical protein
MVGVRTHIVDTFAAAADIEEVPETLDNHPMELVRI